MFLRCIKNQNGSSAVQFAFVAPILILLSLGIIDMGRVGFSASTVRNAAIEAARYASMHGAASTTPATEDVIVALAKDKAVGIPADDLTVTVTWTPDNKSGSEIKVDLDYTVNLFISGFIPIPGINLSRSSAMMIF
jgi:Flp pilus assembly protein TadG